jgi:CMP-N-acetylneuraminic acid synthetase
MLNSNEKLLITICARKGSKGVPSKNIRPMLGKPLIVHTIDQALRFGKKHGIRIVVSTDGEEIARIAREAGAEVPFMRPAEMATDSAGKLPVVIHALKESEKLWGETYPLVIDLDPTAPVRTLADMERGLEVFRQTRTHVCFSVCPARKNPYFNMVERRADGKIDLSKRPSVPIASRQSAPKVWDMNASIYFFSREFLMKDPRSFWETDPEIFEMPPESAFDIDEERDFLIVETLMQALDRREK